MKLAPYRNLEAHTFDSEAVKAVSARVAVGKADGADNFCMRVFEIGEGGFTPRHRHAWEHEIFFHKGTGEVFLEGAWRPVEAGCAVFIPGEAEHQIRNTGEGELTFICVIPSGVPEI